MKQINVLWVCACIINHIFVKIIRMPVLDVSCYSLNLHCNNVVIYLDHSISVLKAIPWCKHIALIQNDFLPRTTTPFVSWCKHCCNNFFFWVDPGQPIWPVTRSLERVDDRVGFQNYAPYTRHPKLNTWLFIYWMLIFCVIRQVFSPRSQVFIL